MTMPVNSCDCPNADLTELCIEISQMRNVRVIECRVDEGVEPSLAFLSLEQTVHVRTKSNPTLVALPIMYTYFLDFEQGPPRYEGTLPGNIPISDPEMFSDQSIQVNNIGDDVVDKYDWDVRLDTHNKSVNDLIPGTKIQIKIARKAKVNRDSFINEFLEATLALDAAIRVFYLEWRPPNK